MTTEKSKTKNKMIWVVVLIVVVFACFLGYQNQKQNKVKYDNQERLNKMTPEERLEEASPKVEQFEDY